MSKKKLILISIVVLILFGAFGWFLFRSAPNTDADDKKTGVSANTGGEKKNDNTTDDTDKVKGDTLTDKDTVSSKENTNSTNKEQNDTSIGLPIDVFENDGNNGSTSENQNGADQTAQTGGSGSNDANTNTSSSSDSNELPVDFFD